MRAQGAYILYRDLVQVVGDFETGANLLQEFQLKAAKEFGKFFGDGV